MFITLPTKNSSVQLMNVRITLKKNTFLTYPNQAQLYLISKINQNSGTTKSRQGSQIIKPLAENSKRTPQR